MTHADRKALQDIPAAKAIVTRMGRMTTLCAVVTRHQPQARAAGIDRDAVWPRWTATGRFIAAGLQAAKIGKREREEKHRDHAKEITLLCPFHPQARRCQQPHPTTGAIIEQVTLPLPLSFLLDQVSILHEGHCSKRWRRM